MRWPGIGRLDAVKLDGFQSRRVALQMLFQLLDRFAVFDEDFVQLLDLALEMRCVRFEFFQSR